MEVPASVIVQNVRDFLMSVDDLTVIKFRDVRRALEKRLGLAKHSLYDKKEEMKDIIRDETLKLHQERSQMSVQSNLDNLTLPMNNIYDKPPHKPLSAYMYFCQERRNEMKNIKPAIENHDIMKELSMMWNNLDVKEKNVYELLANNDKIRYENENNEWRMRHSSGSVNKPRVRKNHSLLDEDMEDAAPILGPKKPRSAYIYYCQEHRDRCRMQNPGMAPTDVSKILGTEWNNLSAEDKNKYRALESEDRERYKNELEDMGLRPEDLRKNTSRQSSISSISRAKSAYVFFKSERQEEVKQQHPEWSMNDIAKELATVWKSLSEDQKRPYTVYAYEDKERVKKEVDKIKATVKSAPYHSVKKERGGKRARTPYTLFYKEQMKIMREKNKDIPFGEISKLLSNMWKELTDEGKTPYVEQSKQEHDNLLLRDPTYLMKSRKRHIDEPRRPCNSYALFCKAKRQDVKKIHPDITSGDVLKELGKLWRETAQEEKDMFEKMAQIEREKYEMEKEKYLSPEMKMKKHDTISMINNSNISVTPSPVTNTSNMAGNMGVPSVNNTNGLLDQINSGMYIHNNSMAGMNLNPTLASMSQLMNLNPMGNDDKNQLTFGMNNSV